MLDHVGPELMKSINESSNWVSAAIDTFLQFKRLSEQHD